MRSGHAVVLALLLGCDSAGSQLSPPNGGVDATTATDGAAGEDAEPDAIEEASAPACIALDASLPVPSSACVYAGSCPASCNTGTASAYLCLPGPDAALSYPAVYLPPTDSVTIVGVEPAAYPWDAMAYLSCAALTCTRWATADHVDGASAWPADPCAPPAPGDDESGDPADAAPFVATQAWACATQPGLMPSATGCIAAGDLQQIGGPGTGIPLNDVWCCPPPTSDAGTMTEPEGGDAGDASLD